MARWLGLDIGSKWTGIAMTDELDIVEPRETIKTINLIEKLKEYKENYDIEGIVVGLPLTTKGKLGERAKMVEKISNEIESELNLSVKLYDERFTTKEAIEIAKQIGKTKDKRLLDRISATLILKSYIEDN
jgi:putative Holliday junction resolvase